MLTETAPVQLRLILPSVARLDLTDEERDELVRERETGAQASGFGLRAPRQRASQ
jgi:hypothetical protein